jgi:hypothetical protein
MGNFLSKILGAGAAETITAIGDAISKVDKSDVKLDLQLKYKELINQIEGTCVDYEGRLLENQSQIVQSESKGESWLQRNWRPMLMMVCMYIIFSNYVLVPYFHIPPVVLDQNIWDLLKIGVGGYVAGRSLEKISENISPNLFNVKKQKK